MGGGIGWYLVWAVYFVGIYWRNYSKYLLLVKLLIVIEDLDQQLRAVSSCMKMPSVEKKQEAILKTMQAGRDHSNSTRAIHLAFHSEVRK